MGMLNLRVMFPSAGASVSRLPCDLILGVSEAVVQFNRSGGSGVKESSGVRLT